MIARREGRWLLIGAFGLESWTQVILSARRLHSIDANSDFANHAVMLAARRMSITKGESQALVGLLSD